MKKYYSILLVLAGLIYASLAVAGREWEDLSVYSINTEKPRATFMPYDTEDKVFRDDYRASPYYKLLNGNWKFK